MKKWNLNNKYIGWGITAFLVLFGFLIAYYLLFHGSVLVTNLGKIFNILMPVMFGLIIAYLLTPVLNYIEQRIMLPLCRKIGWKDGKKRDGIVRLLCTLITVFLFFLIIYVLIYMLISEIVPSVMNIASNYDQYISNFSTWLDKILEDNPILRDNANKILENYSEEIDEWFNTTVMTKSSQLLKAVSMGVLGSIKILWNLIIGLIISIYVMLNKEKFSGQAKKALYAFFDRNTANIVINNFKFTHNTFSGFIGGKILDSFLIGCLCFMGTALMHTPYAALVSVIIGVTNVIPFFGPYLGAIPSAILIFIVDPMHPLNCVYFALFILALQQFDGNVLGPKILGNSTGLTSFWVIFAITFFGGLWGVGGMLVGVPFFAVIYAAIKSLINAKLIKKELPIDSDLYTYVCAIDENGLHTYVPLHRQDAKKKEIYQFGERFISDSDEQINGDEMTKIIHVESAKSKTAKTNNKTETNKNETNKNETNKNDKNNNGNNNKNAKRNGSKIGK